MQLLVVLDGSLDLLDLLVYLIGDIDRHGVRKLIRINLASEPNDRHFKFHVCGLFLSRALNLLDLLLEMRVENLKAVFLFLQLA